MSCGFQFADHQLSKRILFDIVWSSPDFKHLYMLPPSHSTNPWMMDFFVKPPDANPSWIQVSGSSYTKEAILEQNTLMGLITPNVTRYPTNSGGRWQLINPLWMRCSVQLISNLNIKKRYLQAMYEQGLSEGVIYFESRRNLGGELYIYVLNSSSEYIPTNGKQFLGVGGDMEVDIAMDLARNFSMLHPDYVGHKRISYTYRQNSPALFKKEMDNVVRLHGKYPQHVLGFDAVGEEDAGFSTLNYLENYLSLFDASTGQSRVPLYLHTAETNWPGDLLVSSVEGDLLATAQNSFETLLLNAKRIGHGIGFLKHPYLFDIIRRKQIPIEVCPVSSQLLGYFPDLRNHPGQVFYRSGIPIVLSPDDPGTFGYDNFTVDWYQAFMAWGLDLGDLKQLALNSLNHSGMTDQEKKDAIEKRWTPMWNRYIEDMHGKACSRKYSLEARRESREFQFFRILPREGAISGMTKIHVLGRNFEQAICQTPLCQFGSSLPPSAATYVSNHHIVCQAPDCAGCSTNTTIPLYIAFDGKTFVNTNLNFTYKYPPMPNHAHLERTLHIVFIAVIPLVHLIQRMSGEDFKSV